VAAEGLHDFDDIAALKIVLDIDDSHDVHKTPTRPQAAP
jgi:hypothetical protein